MVTRKWPVKQFGGIPELDGHIKKGPFKGVSTDNRFKVGEALFGNVTEARQQVAKDLGLEASFPPESLFRMVGIRPNGSSAKRGKTTKKPIATRRAAKKQAGLAAAAVAANAVQTTAGKRKYTRKSEPNGIDQFGSARRTFVRIPDGTEISFPENASYHMMEATLRLVRRSK